MARSGAPRSDRLSAIVLLATDQRRGAEIRGVELADALRTRGVHVEVVAAYSSEADQRVDVATLARPRQRLRAAVALRRRAHRADVVIGLGPGTLPVANAALMGRRQRFVYSFVFDPAIESRSRLHGRAMRLLMRRADAAVVMWDGARVEAARRFGLGAEVVRWIPNARSARSFAPADREERRAARVALGVPLDAPVVAFVGALSPTKRPDVAAAAVAQVEGAWMLVAGEGPLRADLERSVLAATGRLRLVGAVTDVRAVYAAADVLVVTSVREGGPGVVVEAALCGVATVGVDVGGLREMVGDGRHGVVVEGYEPGSDADALGAALRAALPHAVELGERARAWALSSSTWDAVGEQWAVLLTEVCGRRVPVAQ